MAERATIRTGRQAHPATARQAPLTLAQAVSGRIAAVGEGVSDLREGAWGA
jgi:NADPH:quinone reductase-like Zn-dependent oxidoreductase